MDKEQFKLQIQHNRYIRSTIVCVCRIIIYSIIYAFFISFLIQDIATYIAKNAAAVGQATSASSVFGIIIVVSLVYLGVIICEIKDRIRQHKLLSQAENYYFKEDLTLYREKIKQQQSDRKDK